MSVHQLEDIHSAGVDVLGTTQDVGGQAPTGSILAQTGDVVAEEPASDGAEWWQHTGFASRPAKPTAGKAACQAVTLNRGDRDIIIGSRDLRVTVPALQEGEVVLFAIGSDLSVKASILLKQDGTINVNASGQVNVMSSGKVVVQGSEVDLADASDFAALAAKVDQNFSNLSTTLGSGAASVTVTGGLTGGGPVAFATPFSPAPTSASKVKIS